MVIDEASFLRDGQLFDELNRLHWGGRVPPHRVVRSARLPRGFSGLCDGRRREILLAPDLRGSRLRLTPLHEMCHAALAAEGRGDGHGPNFWAELLRLANRGEAGARAEAEFFSSGLAEAWLACSGWSRS